MKKHAPTLHGTPLPPTAQIRASSQVQDRLRHKMITPLETKSLYALAHYAADHNHVAPREVFATVENRFGVDHVTHLDQQDYEAAIRFLVDLKLDELTVQ